MQGTVGGKSLWPGGETLDADMAVHAKCARDGCNQNVFRLGVGHNSPRAFAKARSGPFTTHVKTGVMALVAFEIDASGEGHEQ